jgi:hypothetical protein
MHHRKVRMKLLYASSIVSWKQNSPRRSLGRVASVVVAHPGNGVPAKLLAGAGRICRYSICRYKLHGIAGRSQ